MQKQSSSSSLAGIETLVVNSALMTTYCAGIGLSVSDLVTGNQESWFWYPLLP